jgi:hypothetical protein
MLCKIFKSYIEQRVHRVVRFPTEESEVGDSGVSKYDRITP